MKTVFGFGLLLFSQIGFAQYYYKDVVGTRESAELLVAYEKAAVRTVTLKTFTVNNTPLENISVQQEFLPAQRALRTVTKSDYTDASYLTTYGDAGGRLIRTTDSVNGLVNTTQYTYDAAGRLRAVLFVAGDTLTVTKTDEHIWQYDAQNRLRSMLRIKNNRDTSVVSFKLDERGNVIEEQEKRRGATEEPFYYYYDDNNRLTDIVRYNKKAARLLPETMFEYSDKNQVIQRITVPLNSDDYFIWRYAYNDRGLKTREAIFNKAKEQTGRVEYSYTFGR